MYVKLDLLKKVSVQQLILTIVKLNVKIMTDCEKLDEWLLDENLVEVINEDNFEDVRNTEIVI